MKHPLVYIEWCDAMENMSNWSSISDVIEWADNEDWIVNQVGWVIKETKEYILLAGEIGNPNSEDPLAGHVLKIPTTWILKRVDLSKHIK